MKGMVISICFFALLVASACFHYGSCHIGDADGARFYGAPGTRSIYVDGNRIQEFSGEKYLFFRSADECGVSMSRVDVSIFPWPSFYVLLVKRGPIITYTVKESFLRANPENISEASEVWNQMSNHLPAKPKGDIMIVWETIDAKAI